MLVGTIDSDDEVANDGVSSDDDDYEMGGDGAGLGEDLHDPSSSGKWKTGNARSNLKAASAESSVKSSRKLDAKLAERAAKKPQTDAPALTPEEAASDLKERRQAKKKESKKKAKEKELADEAEEGADDPLTAVEATDFASLKLSKPLLKAVWELGFAAPTPIQAAVLPAALRGQDVCASAQTGSGKTAAFLLPALERLLHRSRRIAATRVLVLTPTRELAAQCEEMGRQLARFTDVTFALIVGGLSSKLQEADLRTRPDIVVATPGRLIDLLRNAPSVSIDELEILVLDEADRLLELGFEQEVTAASCRRQLRHACTHAPPLACCAVICCTGLAEFLLRADPPREDTPWHTCKLRSFSSYELCQ